jgi:hypothetical protein
MHALASFLLITFRATTRLRKERCDAPPLAFRDRIDDNHLFAYNSKKLNRALVCEIRINQKSVWFFRSPDKTESSR